MEVTAQRLDDGEIEIAGVTHVGTVPTPSRRQFIGWATPDHRWIVVRTGGLWVFHGNGDNEYKTFPGSVVFHRMYRSESAAYADAQSLKGGRVVVVQ